MIKTDAGGNVIWTNTFGGSLWDLGESVQQTTDGGYIIAGRTSSYGAGGADVYLIKTDGTGNMLWYNTFGGASWDYAKSVQQTSDGGYIICGTTMSFGAGGLDIYLIKTDSNGCVAPTLTLLGTDTFCVGDTVSLFLNGSYTSYLWSTGDTTQTIQVTQSGNYYVYFTNNINCSGYSDTITLTAVVCVGINEITKADYPNIHPNPTAGKFTVQGATGEIQVYDLFGRLLLRTNKQEIDMSNYPAGLYIWRIGTARGKLVIE